MVHDLLIRNGNLFDPARKEFRTCDIAVNQGKIASLGAPGSGGEAKEVIDASGLIVTPGLIDFHVHIFHLVHRISIHPHALVPRAGTTTMVDGGSAGAGNFDALREFVLARSDLNLLAFLNISLLGQVFEMQIPGVPPMNEYEDLRLVNVAETVRCAEANRDRIVGIKVRAFHGLTNMTPIHAAIEAGEETALPMMIHTSPAPPSAAQYIPLLRPGDIVTHIYHPRPGSILDGRGKIRAEYREARQRGVLMETGWDRWHTDFDILRAAVGEGFWPDIISTDVTRFNVEPLVRDLLFTASKMLAAGMPLADVLAAMTVNPARAMKRPELAEVREGGPASLTVLETLKEDVRFVDFFGKKLPGKERLVCRRLINRGKVVEREPAGPGRST
ncbi:MAG TPA: amidohydrolase/deacetylase family metallohydrolase [Thermodesulfobacteriota bacterium]|nr:amidohydrolase/deacetylase family metallohydrolase [Thermodesulfobacteriota bacterium]